MWLNVRSEDGRLVVVKITDKRDDVNLLLCSVSQARRNRTCIRDEGAVPECITKLILRDLFLEDSRYAIEERRGDLFLINYVNSLCSFS